MNIDYIENSDQDVEFVTSAVAITTPGSYRFPAGVGIKAKSKFTIFTSDGCFSILPPQMYASSLDGAFTIHVAEGNVVEFDLTPPVKGRFAITKLEDDSVLMEVNGVKNEVEEVMEG